jgi:anti-sigma factor RsiW
MRLPRRHPASPVFSAYLDGDLDARAHRELEKHVRNCARCRAMLASLTATVRALGSLETNSPPGLADSIIAALRAESPPQPASRHRPSGTAAVPALSLVPGAISPARGDGALERWPEAARTALRWCLQPRQLRLTVPIAVVAGVVLSLVNMGGMLMHGKIDLGVCLSCAADFLVPFLALNLGLLMLLRLPGRRRTISSRGGTPPLA